MKLKDLLYRYTSFTLAKIALLFSKSLILILCYKWLPSNQFAVIAATLSLVEIVRALSDFGAESIIYSRLSPSHASIPILVKKIIQLRLAASVFALLFLELFSVFFHKINLWPFFFLPLIGSVQNSSFAFLQKNRRFQHIFYMVILIALLAIVTIIFVLTNKPSGILLTGLMVLPECISACIAAFLTIQNWRETLSVKLRTKKLLSRLYPYILPSTIISALVMLYSRLDVVLVYPLLGKASQVQYSLAIRFVEPLFMILSLGAVAFLAELGAYNSRGARAFIEVLLKFLNGNFYFLILMFSILLAFIIQSVFLKVLHLTDSTGWIIFICAAAIPIKLCNSLLSMSLQRLGYYYVVMRAAIGVFICTVVFGLVFGICYGVIGVAVATTFSEVLNFIYQRYKLHCLLRDY